MSLGVLKSSKSNDALASRVVPLVGFGILTLLFFVLFGTALLKLTDRWSKDPSYSHGFIVPLISLWLARRAYRRAGAPAEGDVRIGSIAILAGAFLHVLLTLINNPLLDFVAVALVLWGLAVAIGGVEWAKHFLFPIGFLFFMFPLPATWTNYAALVLQDWVAQGSAAILDLFVVCYRRGNSLYLASVHTPLVVAAECSGLRQIVAFVALGVLVGGLSRKSMAFRVLLIAAAIPAAILANVARILLMGAGSVWFGTEWMGGWMHDAPALVTLPLGLALLVLVGWGLSRLRIADLASGGRKPPVETPEENATGDGNATGGLRPPLAESATDSALRKGLLTGCVCLFLVVVAQLGLTWHLRSAEISPYPDLTAPLASLPLEVKNPLSLPDKTGETPVPPALPLAWRGQDMEKLDAFRLKLPYKADDLLSRTYQPLPAGAPLNLYMVYSRLGDDRKHHPEICIRDASGAAEDFAARRRIFLDAEGQRPVMRFRFRTGASQYTTVYYWHYTFEALPRKGQSSLQALYQRQKYPTPSMTVQVSLVADPNELEAVERGFLVAVDSALQKDHLPSTAQIGCHRLPIALLRD